MAKGGNQRRRLEAKKAAERAARKRAARRRQAMTWLIGLVILTMIGLLAFAALGGDEPDLSAKSSGDPTPSPTEKCVGEPKKKFGTAPGNQLDKKKDYTATMATSAGTIEIELLVDAAPATVNNFVFLAREKFYDQSLFHRVIAGFGGPGSDMVQGGDATACDGSGDPGYSFGDENMIPFDKPGYIAMANSGPGTNGSQFFFLSGPVQHLNKPGTCPGKGCHSVFGLVTQGLDVVTAIAKSPLEQERPNPPIIVASVTIKES